MQCKGNESVAGGSWMNLNGNAGQVMLPLLRILASPDQLHRSLSYQTSLCNQQISLYRHRVLHVRFNQLHAMATACNATAWYIGAHL